MLKGLIETPSVSATSPQWDMSNEAVINLIATWLEDSGFQTRVLPVPDEPGKFNVIGQLGQGKGGLVLAGHSDTVPHDEDGWQHDPFALTETQDRYYGLGTSDMKSFIALAIEASKRFAAGQLQAPLTILATADEETSMSGAHALCAQDLAHPRYAVIGEPTGLKPVRQHKGILMEAITLHGRSGHSSDPSLGNSALEGMHEVIQSLMDYREELQSRHKNEAFAIPVPTLNFGHIHGGDNPNRICPDCELHIDFRTIPGLSISSVRRGIRERVVAIATGRGLKYNFRELFGGIDAMQTDSTSAIVSASEELTGAANETVAFGTEGPILNSLGIDTVILGPGDIAQAHQPDEFLLLERIPPTISLLEKLIQRFCVSPS